MAEQKKTLSSIFVIGVATFSLAACGPQEPAEPPKPPKSTPSATPETKALSPEEELLMRGQRVFLRCKTCHSNSAEQGNKIGPHLEGIVGRQVATIEKFRYSNAMAGSEEVWTEEKLFDYLENPRAMYPGTTMAFAGLRNPTQREQLIAYLKSL